jgi:hypothetical protein
LVVLGRIWSYLVVFNRIRSQLTRRSRIWSLFIAIDRISEFSGVLASPPFNSAAIVCRWDNGVAMLVFDSNADDEGFRRGHALVSPRPCRRRYHDAVAATMPSPRPSLLLDWSSLVFCFACPIRDDGVAETVVLRFAIYLAIYQV